MDAIVGTAGHIDHGKTAVVKELTGIDADRLPEEKLRGITIDLGFAEMSDGDVHIGFVDVPGHERFVKNMLAGASGIDLVMLVVAADEGVMPQTREHFEICRLLRIKSGIVVLTKTDLADAETRELAELEVSELVTGSFLENAPVFAVSSKTGEGIAELKQGIIDAAKKIDREKDTRETRLAIDRSFSIKGFGAVVTGTLASGNVDEGDELIVLPSGRKVRVRGIQTHGNNVKRVQQGQRTAVNLGGIDHDELVRGMTLTRAGSIATTQVVDVEVEVLADAPRGLRSRQRVRVHLGTAEVLARVSILSADQKEIEPGATGYAQFRFESAAAAVHGDRFIVRSYSPQRTIAGGRVLDPNAKRHKRSDLRVAVGMLGELGDGTSNIAETFIRMSGRTGTSSSDLRTRTGLRADVMGRLVEQGIAGGKVVDAEGVLVATPVFDELATAAIAAVESHHLTDKLSRGLQLETLREQVFKGVESQVFRSLMGSLEKTGKLAFDRDVVRSGSYDAQLTPAETRLLDDLRRIYATAGLESPKMNDALREAADGSGLDEKAARKLFQVLVRGDELVAVTGEFYFQSGVLDDLTAKLRAFADRSGDRSIDVAKFKEIAGVSRKYAIPLLEYFDRTRVTRRVGDKRQIL